MDTGASLNTSDVTPLLGLISEEMHLRLISVISVLDILLGVLATGANVVTIIVYLRLGFSDSINISLIALAISDCGIAVTTISMTLCMILPEIMTTDFTNGIGMATSAYPHVLFSRISGLITMYLSIERYLCVSLPLKVKTIITPRRTFIVMVIIFSIFAMYPLGYIRYPIAWIFHHERNTTLLAVFPVTDPNIILVGNIYILIVASIIPLFTFFSVVLCTILLTLSLQKSKAWRDTNKSAASTTTGTLDEGSKSALKPSKEMRAVKMLIIIATVFIVASIPSCVHIVGMMAVPGYSLNGRFDNVWDVISMSTWGVNSINSGVNVVIYYRMSIKFRQAVLGLFCKRFDSRS